MSEQAGACFEKRLSLGHDQGDYDPGRGLECWEIPAGGRDCAGGCERGLNVAPFKPQNMSNNAAVTVDEGEIGRAQALQARACGLDPIVDMNPVLLKPETDTGAQVIVQGKRFATMKARDYGKAKAELMPRVLESFHRLGRGRDLVLVEGAGSPAEVNLRKGDIANMALPKLPTCPSCWLVTLIGVA